MVSYPVGPVSPIFWSSRKRLLLLLLRRPSWRRKVNPAIIIVSPGQASQIVWVPPRMHWDPVASTLASRCERLRRSSCPGYLLRAPGRLGHLPRSSGSSGPQRLSQVLENLCVRSIHSYTKQSKSVITIYTTLTYLYFRRHSPGAGWAGITNRVDHVSNGSAPVSAALHAVSWYLKPSYAFQHHDITGEHCY